jgi:hypothetical protein
MFPPEAILAAGRSMREADPNDRAMLPVRQITRILIAARTARGGDRHRTSKNVLVRAPTVASDGTGCPRFRSARCCSAAATRKQAFTATRRAPAVRPVACGPAPVVSYRTESRFPADLRDNNPLLP